LNEKGNIIPYKQDLQEAIFNEKQTIIENCLFGVDINPNSVNICRLRLWIELLKHTFYTNESNYTELETLPNIDINIKQGNSLISNFGMNGNGHTNGQSQKIRLATQKYKDQVILYKSTDNKKVKQDAEKKIAEIKTMFSEVVRPLDKDYKLLKKKEAQLGQMPMLFTQEDKENWEIKRTLIQAEIDDLNKIIENKKKSIYINAFEWRFEFPEVLDENGNFVGFDIIIGNPPWVSLMGKYKGIDNDKVIEFYKTIFPINTYMPNLYEYFITFGFTLLKNNGLLALITPDRLGKNENLKYVRKDIIENYSLISYIYHWNFPGIVADTMTIIAKKSMQNAYSVKTRYKPNFEAIHISKKQIVNSNYIFISYKTQVIYLLIENIKNNSIYLKDIAKTTSGFGGKSTLIKSKQTNKNQIKIVKGENITPYMLDGNFYFNFDTKNITGRTRDLNKLTKKEKVFLRKTGNKIISCYDDSGIVPEQSVYFVYDIVPDISPQYLTALLNSKLMTFYYQNELVTNIESIAQLKNSDLYKIPIVKADKQKQTEITKIVSKIVEQKKQKADTNKLETEIDNIVYKLYNIPNEMIGIIEKK
ncbi:MAG: Eco57I restriction-modification methylase domain-containing protein, partial [Bacteroidales bacterium]|nr:Eco57I restriction-modification methylase domain-containing protein [Bacteroidales bacterium]